MKSCAFTGHRPKSFPFGYHEEHPDCIRLKAVLREQIEELYGVGFTRFITGCAIGVDMWAGEIVTDLMKSYKDIELICVVPFEEQATHWSEKDRERYFDMLSSCTGAVTMQSRYTDDCYTKRNRYMIDHADVLLAVCDPNSNRRSGSAATVNYARKQRVPVILVHPATFEVNPRLQLIRS